MSDRSSSDSVEHERSSSENVTIIAETFSENAGATVSSIKSEDSTEQLICKTPQQKSVKNKVDKSSATLDRYEVKTGENVTKSLELGCGSEKKRRRHWILVLGVAQAAAGVALVACGALVIVRGAALARTGAGLWAGGAGVATGVVGLLAGVNDCYGLYGAGRGRSSPLLTAFLALSLTSLAAGNMAAVLAGTGLYRDANRNRMPEEIDGDIEDERAAWTPVLANIGLLIAACAHCLLALAGVYHASRRLCPCFRPREPFNHNQFDPACGGPYVVRADGKEEARGAGERARSHELCRQLERRLGREGERREAKRKAEEGFGSASSKDKLVSSWLGRQPAGARGGGAGARGGVRKMKAPHPIMLVPAPGLSSHPASTLGRSLPMPPGVLAVAPRYATLPPPPHYHHVYYPHHDARGRRRRTARPGGGGGGGGAADRRARTRARGSQLTRSLERIHRKPAASDADLRRTYTGLDRTIAEQFIAVCDETRAHPHPPAASSLRDTASSDCNSNRY